MSARWACGFRWLFLLVGYGPVGHLRLSASEGMCPAEVSFCYVVAP